MKYTIQDLIDIERLQALLESYSEASSITTALVDLDGNVLIATGWKDICSKMHRLCPEATKKCTERDTDIAREMVIGSEYNVYKCLNGLMNVAVPIVVHEESIGNLFIKQFLFEAPDLELFRQQAATYGFGEDAYLDALSKVPIIPESEIQSSIKFLLNLTRVLAEMGVNRIRQFEDGEALQKSELHYRTLISQMANGFALYEIICGPDGSPIDYRFLEVNATFEQMTGLKGEEIVGKTVLEVLPETEETRISQYGLVAMTGQATRFESYSQELQKHFEVLAYCPKHEEFAVVFTDITKRKQAEEEITRLARFPSENPNPVLKVGGDGVIIYANEGSGSLLEEWECGVGAMLPEEYQRVVRKVLESGVKTQVDVSCIERFLTLVFCPIADSQEVNVYGLDITDRKLAEDELKISQYYLEKAQEIGNLGTWNLDLQKNVLTWTDEHYRIFGVPIGTALTYETFLGCLHPDDKDFVDKEWKAALNGKPYDIEHRVVADGEVKWVREKAELIRDEAGNAIRATGVTQDITDRKQTHDNLEQSEMKFRTLYENSPNGIVICELIFDEEGKLVDYIQLQANAAAAKHIGIGLEEIVGKRASTMCTHEELAVILDVYEKVVTTAMPGTYTLFCSYYDITVEVTTFPLRGNILIASFVNISGRIKADAEIAQHREHLEELVAERTSDLEKRTTELREIVNLMAGREIRMAQLKRVIEKLHAQLEAAGMTPSAHIPPMSGSLIVEEHVTREPEDESSR
jgi:PAS domain S-box-containing protein